jgi:putative MATE family efflux protein
MENRKAIFETMSVPRAVASLAIPTILSQLVTMIYNLADTFFVGQTGDPLKVAAVSLAFPAFMILTAFGNLFGIGGGSLISRLLGAGKPETAKNVTAFSFYSVILSAFLYSVVVMIFMDPLLRLLGASDNTIGFGRDYLFWVVVIGGIPTALSMTIAHLLRSEGRARQASIGIVMGGVLNIILDPIFIFPLNLGVAGAAIATMLSNVVVVIFYLYVFARMRGKTVISFHPRHFTLEGKLVSSILAIGFPAFLSLVLVCLSSSIIMHLASGYGDTSVAAFGIIQRVNSIPFNISLGLSQGILPLIAYSHSAKRFDRMKAVSRFARFVGIGFAMFCIVIFEWLAGPIIRIFINDSVTVFQGAAFLRITCLSIPLIIMNFLLNTTFQAMGKGRQSLIFAICRQGVFQIPLLFLLNSLVGLYGLIWAQLITETLTMMLAFWMYRGILNQIQLEEAQSRQILPEQV